MDFIELKIHLDVAGDVDDEVKDSATRQLLQEIRELDLEEAKLATGVAPSGAKSGAETVIGSLVVTLASKIVPQLLDFFANWMTRNKGRTLKFEGYVGGKKLKVEGVTFEELKMLLTASPPGR